MFAPTSLLKALRWRRPKSSTWISVGEKGPCFMGCSCNVPLGVIVVRVSGACLSVTIELSQSHPSKASPRMTQRCSKEGIGGDANSQSDTIFRDLDLFLHLVSSSMTRPTNIVRLDCASKMPLVRSWSHYFLAVKLFVMPYTRKLRHNKPIPMILRFYRVAGTAKSQQAPQEWARRLSLPAAELPPADLPPADLPPGHQMQRPCSRWD
jgi:hypothetical protein